VSDTAEGTLASAASARPPFYRDATVVKWLVQVAALLLVVGVLAFSVTRAADNLAANDINTGYDFLSVDPGFDLSEGIDTSPDTGGRALWVGMVNTIRLSIAGIALATVLGVIIGVSRLSSNWIVSRLASAYIEAIRNVPLLVQIVFIFAVIASLDRVALDQGPVHGWIHLSSKGLSVPRVFPGDGFYQWMVFVLLGLGAGRLVMQRRRALQEATGRLTYPLLSLLGVVAVFAVLGWFLHPIFGFLGGFFDLIADGIEGVPPGTVQILLCGLAVTVWLIWIRRFLSRRRTPAGLAKLTDDDWFRMIFGGFGALAACAVVLLVWPGMASWIVNSGSDLFVVLGDKFGDGRDGIPINALRPDIVQPGNFPNYGAAGLNFSQGLAAVYFGVVLYTAAFIAEIVRGGILAVPVGQTEAALAVGLKRITMLRLVVLPQALRVVLPPLGNQYLNLTKNTSLAIAVGYSDLVQVGQTVFNQTGKTLEVFSIWMGFYLACSLTISVVVNFFNVRLKIVER